MRAVDRNSDVAVMRALKTIRYSLSLWRPGDCFEVRHEDAVQFEALGIAEFIEGVVPCRLGQQGHEGLPGNLYELPPAEQARIEIKATVENAEQDLCAALLMLERLHERLCGK